jgi:hypothetical protein
MSNPPFNFHSRMLLQHAVLASSIIGDLNRPPDLIIAPKDYGEYLFRWYVIPRNDKANVYFHVQTQSDPERPLHDHPWDNTSVILVGGYDEIIDMEPDHDDLAGFSQCRLIRKKGDVIHRPATWAHRLILPPEHDYTMTLFMTGPKVRKWGFWDRGVFKPYEEVTVETEGKSTWKGMA